MATIESIRDELNRRAAGRPIGEIQQLRKRLRGWSRLAASVVFGAIRGISRGPEPAPDYPYTFHVGGREEMQFNIGLDPFDNLDLRYGVAFSFEPSRSYPSIAPLLSRVQLFNDYLREHPAEFADLWMWHHSPGGRSDRRRPGPITPDMAQIGNFVFMGALGRTEEPDYDEILAVLDRLMPLWQFIEETRFGADPLSAVVPPLRPPRPNWPNRPAFTTASLAERLLDINLRHNVLQQALLDELIGEYDEEAVRWEDPAPGGGLIDASVTVGGVRILYEIKTAATARGCVREAMGQLLDYGLWPGSPPAAALVVVGEPEADDRTTAYLGRLSAGLPAPITYRRIIMPADDS